jgi:hypothetical protein
MQTFAPGILFLGLMLVYVLSPIYMSQLKNFSSTTSQHSNGDLHLFDLAARVGWVVQNS